MSSPSNHKQHNQSQIPVQFRAISRNNSNTSTASSSNKGDISSTISTTNSVASSRSQLSKHQLITDHRQLFATCGSSTPIRSFQRATISSVVKTRAFDNNPMLQGLLAASPSNSVCNSQTPSPHSTPLFSRSRSLRMSGGPQRYQQSPSHHYRPNSRTPELYSFNSGDMLLNCTNESQTKLVELSNEKDELKESLEFLECERQVLIDSTTDLKETLQAERSQWKKDQDDLKKQLTDSIAARVKAESQLTYKDMELNEMRLQIKKLNEQIVLKERQLVSLQNRLETADIANKELAAYNNELKLMLSEKLIYNGLASTQKDGNPNQQVSDCVSIVTEMASLRLELNEKDRLLSQTSMHKQNNFSHDQDIDNLNKFLDQTVECIKGWPEELAGSSHVQNLMKTLLNAYRVDQSDLVHSADGLRL